MSLESLHTCFVHTQIYISRPFIHLFGKLFSPAPSPVSFSHSDFGGNLCMWKAALGFECRCCFSLLFPFWQLNEFVCLHFHARHPRPADYLCPRWKNACDLQNDNQFNAGLFHQCERLTAKQDCRFLMCLLMRHAFCVDTSHRRRTDRPSMPIYTHTPFCAEIKGLSAERVAQWSGRQ